MLQLLKENIKNIRDSLYSKKLIGKKTIGTIDQWTVLIDHLSSGIIYSGGVGKNITFELEMINKYKCIVYAFDPSPTGIDTIKKISSDPNKLIFSDIALGGIDGLIYFNKPANHYEGSFSVENEIKRNSTDKLTFNCKKISTIMSENNHKNIDILKIDIEGSEYDVIDDIIQNQLEIKQICVEFHHWFDSIPTEKTKLAIKKLTNAGYIIFHRHRNDYSFVKLKSNTLIS